MQRPKLHLNGADTTKKCVCNERNVNETDEYGSNISLSQETFKNRPTMQQHDKVLMTQTEGIEEKEKQSQTLANMTIFLLNIYWEERLSQVPLWLPPCYSV